MTRRHGSAESNAGLSTDLAVVALVGRPNVGKSSLFNRLVGGRPALVEDMPGVTRDRRYGPCEWEGVRFRVADTGGLDPSAEGILAAMRVQSLRAVDEAALLLFITDVAEGLTAVDQDVAHVLRRTGKPVFVVVNKVDSQAREAAASEVFGLGFAQVFLVSASHGRGISDLLDAIVHSLRGQAEDTSGDAAAAPQASGALPIRLAFVGKPNVGKSSLVNRLLGEDRQLVHDQPGTTRDPIDTAFTFEGNEFVLVDTAGLRRRGVVKTLTEAVSGKMARDQLARADVAALVIDAGIGATADDARLASLIEESGRAAILILNKNDLVPRAEASARLKAAQEELAFMSYAPLLTVSAKTGRGVSDIARQAAAVFEQWSRRIPTSDLNKRFEEMVLRRPPPSGPSGRHVRLYYATQASVRPPTFFVSANAPQAVAPPYQRYLANQLRAIYGFAGSPIKLVLRGHAKKTRIFHDNPKGKRG